MKIDHFKVKPCSPHRTYKALRVPKGDCHYCNALYLLRMYGGIKEVSGGGDE